MKIAIILLFILVLSNYTTSHEAKLVIFKGSPNSAHTNRIFPKYHVTLFIKEKGIIMTSFEQSIWRLELGKLLKRSNTEQRILIEISSIHQVEKFDDTVIKIHVQKAARHKNKKENNFYIFVSFKNEPIAKDFIKSFERYR
jgi:hypothetical protein